MVLLIETEIVSTALCTVYFDMTCIFCCSAVSWIAARDGAGLIDYRDLSQCPALVDSYWVPRDRMVTICNDVDGERPVVGCGYHAWKLVLYHLPEPWPVLAEVLELVPAPVGQWLYDRIAARFRCTSGSCEVQL